MKLLMKIFSIILIVALGFILAFGFFLSLSDMPVEALRLIEWLISIIFPIVIIAFCCYSVQLENAGMFIRIILAYVIFGILVSAVNCFLPLADINADLLKFINSASSFMSKSYIYIFSYVLISMIRPNNVVCKTMKRISLGALITTILVQIFLYIKIVMVDKLPNVYGHEGFNFATIDESQEMVIKVIFACAIIECFSIVLTYITNYAFNDGIADVGDIDYDELKQTASIYANNEFNKTYVDPLNSPKKKIDRSASQKGLMNVNNQLGVDSNVGKVDGKADSTVVDNFVVPKSSGPVVNDAVNEKKES